MGINKLYAKFLEELGIVSNTNSLDSLHRQHPYVEYKTKDKVMHPIITIIPFQRKGNSVA